MKENIWRTLIVFLFYTLHKRRAVEKAKLDLGMMVLLSLVENYPYYPSYRDLQETFRLSDYSQRRKTMLLYLLQSSLLLLVIALFLLVFYYYCNHYHC